MSLSYKNAVTAMPEKLLDRAHNLFCYSPFAKSHGRLALSAYSKTTILPYTQLMYRCTCFLTVKRCVIYPPTMETWKTILEFRPSEISREAYVRLSSIWQLFCELNSVEMPDVVKKSLRGLCRIMVQPTKVRPLLQLPSRTEIREFIRDLYLLASTPTQHAVIITAILAYWCTMRLSDSLKLLRRGIAWHGRGAYITPNTKKNDCQGTSSHRGYVPNPTSAKDLNVPGILKICVRMVISAAPHSLFLFVQPNGKFYTPSQITREAKKMFQNINTDYISECQLRGLFVSHMMVSQLITLPSILP